jgi:hypothetical protein
MTPAEKIRDCVRHIASQLAAERKLSKPGEEILLHQTGRLLMIANELDIQQQQPAGSPTFRDNIG